jgi:tripartite-type tricarboxylate transporter receptor subunit TctC
MRIRICAHTGCGRFKTVLCAGAALLVGILATASNAQTYPARPVRMIVPFTPGGSTDIYARTLSPKLGDALGQQVVVDNRPGAGGTLGADLAAKSPPDGYTLWIGQTANLAIGPALRKKSPYDPVRDFAPITMVQRASSVLIVNAGSPLRSLKDLIAYAKKTPGGATYGSAGIGTTGHINGFLVAKVAGIELLHVPYKGASPAMLDLQAGRITMMATSIGSSAGMIKQGKIRALATTGAKRAPALPDVPTAAEQGLTGYDVSSWHAVLAPAKTAAPIITRLNRELVAILKLPDTQEKLSSEGGEVMPTTPEEAGSFIRNEVAKWSKLLKDANIPLE